MLKLIMELYKVNNMLNCNNKIHYHNKKDHLNLIVIDYSLKSLKILIIILNKAKSYLIHNRLVESKDFSNKNYMSKIIC